MSMLCCGYGVSDCVQISLTFMCMYYMQHIVPELLLTWLVKEVVDTGLDTVAFSELELELHKARHVFLY